jgi:hypothetical protein
MLGPPANKEKRMKQSGLRRIAIVVAICASVGALAGIAGSAAAPSKSSSKATDAQKAKAALVARARAMKRALRHGVLGAKLAGAGPGFFFGGPVHSEAVVPNADGTGFVTITTDAGTLNSVDGNTLHIKEGTDKKTYKDDVAIDVGANPTVVRNHAKASLSDLKAGDHVRVIKSPKGTFIMAADDAFIAKEKKELRAFRDKFGHHGFGLRRFGPGGPGIPAPGAFPGDEGSQNGSGSSGGSNS